MRRAVALIASVVAAAPLAGPAAAKEPLHAGMVVMCGPSGCAPLDDQTALAWLNGLVFGENPPTPGATPAMAPYYELRFSPTYAEGQPPPLGWLVPSGEAVRAYNFMSASRRSEWYPFGSGVGQAIAAATDGLEPFPSPRLTDVEVGGRQAPATAPYLGLLAPLPETFTPSPGSPRLALDLRAASITPWTLGRTIALEYAPDETAVRISGRWYEVPGSLAERIEVDAGVLSPVPASSPWGSIAAALGAGAIALAAVLLAVRRPRAAPGAVTPRTG